MWEADISAGPTAAISMLAADPVLLPDPANVISEFAAEFSIASNGELRLIT